MKKESKRGNDACSCLKEFFQVYQNHIEWHDRRRNVSLKEKGEKSEYRLCNESGRDLVLYRIDHGLIAREDIPKCDFGIYTEDDWLILIELKGMDYGHALEQIESTINELVKKPQIPITRINGRIVLSRTRIPDILTTREIKLRKLLGHYSGNLDKKTLRMIEKL